MAWTSILPSQGILTDVVDLLLPTHCAGCDAPGASPCPTCCGVLARNSPTRFRPRVPANTPVVVGGPYDGPLRAMLLAHKEQQRHGLRTPLGAVLADAVAALVSDDVLGRAREIVLVPVPSSRAAVRRRREDTVADLARSAEARLRASDYRVGVVRALAHRRRVDDQVGLPAWARRANVAEAFEVRASVQRRLMMSTVIVVDDVVTTGATAAEAGRALMAHGVRVCGTAAVAGTRMQGGRGSMDGPTGPKRDIGPVVPDRRHH